MSTSVWLHPGLVDSLSLELPPEVKKACRRSESSRSNAVSLARGTNAPREGRKDAAVCRGWKKRSRVCWRGSIVSVGWVGSASIVSSPPSIGAFICCFCCCCAEKIQRRVFSDVGQYCCRTAAELVCRTTQAARLAEEPTNWPVLEKLTVDYLITGPTITKTFSCSTVEVLGAIEYDPLA